MCGIVGYWATGSNPSPLALESLLEHGEKRGTDAFGFSICDKQLKIVKEQKYIGTVNRKEIVPIMIRNMEVGSLLLANYRAAPETEPESRDSETIQPISNSNVCLVHNGSVSRKIYKELSYDFTHISKLDSEAIIWAYYKFGRNMKSAMEFLSGGFAFLMLDRLNRKLFAVCTHNPLYCGYVRGYGLFLSSFSEAIYKAISFTKGQDITRQNTMIWEDYYCREFPENTITEFDLDSMAINETKFTPRYTHPNYDPYISNKIKTEPRRKVIVSASGGLDSSTTLAILKTANYDVTAVHFKYGHRGEKAEELAIENVCRILNIPLVKFDIKEQMKILDNSSMLVNDNVKITTGTEEGLKTTIAWTCFRNGFFATYMGALSENYIINDGFDEVYITGGFLNLTESGAYPDNSERFIKSFIKFCKFSSIVGEKIKPMFCCSNLLKTELYIILDKLGFLKIIGNWLVSCDRPKVVLAKGQDDKVMLVPANCSKDGMPACGSGALSAWAASRASLKDPRRYYNVKDEDYKLFELKDLPKYKWQPIEVILDKLLIHEENLSILKEKILCRVG